jgi:hypothetical protein
MKMMKKMKGRLSKLRHGNLTRRRARMINIVDAGFTARDESEGVGT